MARYIDSKYLVDWCNEMYQKQTQIKGKEYCNAFLQAVVTAPTADVAPKSEVAREIFEEIEAAADYFKELKGIPAMAVSFREYFSKFKNKYTGEQK